MHFFSPGATAPSGPGPPHYQGVLMITLRLTTLGRTPLNKRSAQCRDRYLTTHSPYKRQTYFLPVGFEPTIPASKWPQTHALDCMATEISAGT